MKNIYYIICSIILLCNQSIFSQINGIENSISSTISQYYNDIIKKEKIVGASIAIIDDGVIVYEKGFGFSDRENKIRSSPYTNYRIASITKTFTAFAVMQLHEKGLLDINKSIKYYLPELTIESRFDDSNKFIIKDILSHISGLPSDIYNGHMGNNKVPDINWTIKQLNIQKTASKNNYKMSYSNVGYALLGELIHRTSGLSYDEYINKKIFNPLYMKTSGFGLPDNLSKGYVDKEEHLLSYIRDRAAGSIVSNVHEMANFINMLIYDGQFNDSILLSKRFVDKMEQDNLLNVELSSYDAYGYGLFNYGIDIKDNNRVAKGHLIGHSGDNDAFHSDFIYLPELKIGAIILTNTDNGGSISNAKDLLELYLKEKNGTKIEVIDKFKEYKILTGNQIIGDYAISDGRMKVVNAKKIKFKMGGMKAVLKKQPNNKYKAKILLLGFIPIPLKSMEVAFVEVNDDIYLQMLDVNRKRSEFMAIKSNQTEVSLNWKNVLGEYRITNNYSTCKKCGGDDYSNEDKAKLYLEDDQLIFEISGKNDDVDEKLFLDTISDSIAVTTGIGRGTGVTIKILDNGNVYYSGFEFVKVN